MAYVLPKKHKTVHDSVYPMINHVISLRGHLDVNDSTMTTESDIERVRYLLEDMELEVALDIVMRSNVYYHRNPITHELTSLNKFRTVIEHRRFWCLVDENDYETQRKLRNGLKAKIVLFPYNGFTPEKEFTHVLNGKNMNGADMVFKFLMDAQNRKNPPITGPDVIYFDPEGTSNYSEYKNKSNNRERLLWGVITKNVSNFVSVFPKEGETDDSL